MTQPLSSLIQGILNETAYKTSVEAEVKKLAYRTWHQRYKPAAFAARLALWFLSALSVGTASFFAARYLETMMPAPAAWATALSLLVFGEWLKSFFISQAAYGHFYALSNGQTGGGRAAALCAAILLAGSFWLSVQGALAISEKFADKATSIKTLSAERSDSVRVQAGLQEAALLARIDTLQALRAKRENGLLRDSENKQILLLQGMLAAKTQTASARLAAMTAQGAESLRENAGVSHRSMIAAAGLAAANELLLCICIVFGWAFAHHTKLEREALEEALKRAAAGTPEETPKETPTETPEETPTETAQPKPSIKKDPVMLAKVAALKAQGLSGRAIAAELRIGKSTVGEMIKENEL